MRQGQTFIAQIADRTAGLSDRVSRSDLHSQKAARQALIDERQAQTDALRQQSAEMQAQNAQRKLQNDLLRAQNAEKQVLIAERQAQNDALQAQNARLRALKADLRKLETPAVRSLDTASQPLPPTAGHATKDHAGDLP